MFWCDKNFFILGVRKIECIREDGAGRRVVTDAATYPFSVISRGREIFWSDWTM